MSALALLHLCGVSHLVVHGARVQLHHKALALLGYLALEGPTTREAAADLLWGHAGSANNLRVELHRLRRALRAVAPAAFPSGANPLVLPEPIEIAPIDDPEQFMLGFEDVSPAFEDWLYGQRAGLGRDAGDVDVRGELVRELANSARPPHLVVLKGGPGSGRKTFAKSLARALGLPFTLGVNGATPALHLLDGSTAADPALVERILRDRHSLWVIASSRYAPESELLLKMRAEYPANRLKHVTLGPLTWPEARHGVLQELPFAEAAHFYTYSGGHLGFLSELVEQRRADAAGRCPILPQRVRAAFLLEARWLSEGARTVAQRLCVHPGPLPPLLLRAFEAEAFLDELEALGWLDFDGDYRFASESARKVLYEALPPGQRNRSHLLAAAVLGEADMGMAARFHRQRAGALEGASGAEPGCPPWARATLGWSSRGVRGEGYPAVPFREVALGGRLALLPSEGTVTRNDSENDVTWWRVPPRGDPLVAHYDLPEGPAALRIRYRGRLECPGRVGLDCEAVPLRASLVNSIRRDVVWTDVAEPLCLEGGAFALPLGAEGETLLIVNQNKLRLESRAHQGVLELQIDLFRIQDGDGAASSGALRSALDLT